MEVDKLVMSKNVDSWASEQDPEIRQMAQVLRRAVLDADCRLRESIKWSSPVYSQGREICYITVTEEHVALGFFNGTFLDGLGKTSTHVSKKARKVAFRTLKDIDPDKITSWVGSAIKEASGPVH